MLVLESEGGGHAMWKLEAELDGVVTAGNLFWGFPHLLFVAKELLSMLHFLVVLHVCARLAFNFRRDVLRPETGEAVLAAALNF